MARRKLLLIVLSVFLVLAVGVVALLHNAQQARIREDTWIIAERFSKYGDTLVSVEEVSLQKGLKMMENDPVNFNHETFLGTKVWLEIFQRSEREGAAKDTRFYWVWYVPNGSSVAKPKMLIVQTVVSTGERLVY